MNPAAILALISDLYTQVSALTEENAALRKLVAAGEDGPVERAGSADGSPQS